MLSFFRDVLDGPVYIIIVILAIIFIMAIIGFILERKKLEKEQLEMVATVDRNVSTVTNTEVINNEVIVDVPVSQSIPVSEEVVPISTITIEEPVASEEPEVINIPIVENDPDITEEIGISSNGVIDFNEIEKNIIQKESSAKVTEKAKQ